MIPGVQIFTRSSISKLQPRIHYFVFDLLVLQGRDWKLAAARQQGQLRRQQAA
jgi:hypothetical protein